MLRHEPTDRSRQTVRILKANGNSHKTICLILEIDEKTLMKHYRTELDEALEHVKGQVGAAIVRSALQGNMAAASWWMARRGGVDWKAPKDTEDGEKGATIIIRGGIASVQHEPSDD